MGFAAAAEVYSDALPIGQLITIVPAMPRSNDDRSDKQGYASRVEDVLEDAVVVSMPMRKQSLVPLPLNSPVSAYFHRDGARYYFRAVVGGRNELPFPVLYLMPVGELSRDERRAHVRIQALLEPVEMLVVSEGLGDGARRCPSLVVNISAGGLGLVCRRPVLPGSTIRIVLDLPGGFGRLEADARVVRCRPVELGGVQKWRVGVAFLSMSVADQDRVAAFVLYQQRVLRSKGLL